MKSIVAVIAVVGVCAHASSAVSDVSPSAVADNAYDVRIWDSYPVKETPDIWKNIPPILKEASWIWPFPSNYVDVTNSYALFRETFELTEVPQRAVMYITADQNYRLYVNGKYIAKGPARGFQKSWPYDEVDIAPFLKKGRNAIAVRAYNAGRNTFSYLSSGFAGVLYGVDLGGGQKIVSRRATKCMRQNSCDRDTVPYSMQLNNQEHIDMRADPAGWELPEFDDSAWANTETARRWNQMPYYAYEPRFTLLGESRMLSFKLIGEGSGKSASDAERCRNINGLIAREDTSHRAASSDSEVIKVPPAPKGEFRSYLFDFGKVVVGVPIIEVSGAKGGEIIDVCLSERVSDSLEPVNPYLTHSAPAMSNRMIARAGDSRHEFYHALGARYMMLRVRANPGSELEIRPSFRWEAYPLGRDGAFETSNPLANKIWKACEQTQRVCSLDAYVDTPHREQAQWWGDARVQAWNTFMLCDDPRLLWRGIRQIAMQTAPNGLTYGHAPTMAHHCILPDYSVIWILTLYDYYWQTGDASLFDKYEKTIDGILSYFDGVTNPATGLVSYDPRFWLFLDWTNIQREGDPAVLNLWLLYALDTVSRACAETGRGEMAAKYSARAARLRAAAERNLVDSDGLVRDGVLPGGAPNPLKGVQAQVLGRMTNLRGFDFEKAKSEILLPFLRGELKTHADPSSYWHVYLYDLMADEGYGAEVYADILKKWREMADYGTAFENFEFRHAGISSSHAWSAHPLFLMPRILGGIRQTAPAWREVSFNPLFIEDSGRAVWPTPHGKIRLEWKRLPDGSFEKKLELPEGVRLSK